MTTLVVNNGIRELPKEDLDSISGGWVSALILVGGAVLVAGIEHGRADAKS